jgi:hypothetical protein
MDSATLQWIVPAEDTPEAVAGAREARQSLDEWARARGLHLVLPREESSLTIPVDMTIGDKVEEEIDRGRDAVSALDAEGAERALTRAEGILRAHPELPQAGWLLAEVQRGWASRWSRVSPVDAERAALAWRGAAALDGGRAAGIGEGALAKPAPEVSVTLAFDGEGDALLDGVPVKAETLKRGEGDHQLVVLRDGRIIWAEWVSFAGGSNVRVVLPRPPPCSREELRRVTLREGSVRAGGVRCQEWVVATPVVGSRHPAVLVASCRADRCGPLLEWGVGEAVPLPTVTGHGQGWPAWATWTLVGAGVLGATAVTLVAAGVFRSSSTVTSFQEGGLVVH